MKPCPKCQKGQIGTSWGEADCLQCGYVPRPDRARLIMLMAERNRRAKVNSKAHSKEYIS